VKKDCILACEHVYNNRKEIWFLQVLKKDGFMTKKDMKFAKNTIFFHKKQKEERHFCRLLFFHCLFFAVIQIGYTLISYSVLCDQKKSLKESLKRNNIFGTHWTSETCS